MASLCVLEVSERKGRVGFAGGDGSVSYGHSVQPLEASFLVREDLACYGFEALKIFDLR